jgi:lipoprotein-anchoring transpeptidase ErfK/SrfK
MRTRGLVPVVLAALCLAAFALPSPAFAVLPAPVVTAPTASTLVGTPFTVTGTTGASGQEARVTIDGATFGANVRPDGSFSVSASAPYGRSDVCVDVRDVDDTWSTSTTVTVYNLGAVPAYAHYVLVDKSDFMLYLVRDGAVTAAYPIAIGMSGAPTKTGTWTLGRPMRSPSAVWGALRMPELRKARVKVSYRARVRGRWVRRWKWRTVYQNSSYYIHGTNDPSSIGTAASHGCVRMYNADVIALSRQTGIEPVVIRN